MKCQICKVEVKKRELTFIEKIFYFPTLEDTRKEMYCKKCLRYLDGITESNRLYTLEKRDEWYKKGSGQRPQNS